MTSKDRLEFLQGLRMLPDPSAVLQLPGTKPWWNPWAPSETAPDPTLSLSPDGKTIKGHPETLGEFSRHLSVFVAMSEAAKQLQKESDSLMDLKGAKNGPT